MTAPTSPSDVVYEAATIAFALIRFAEGAAHSSPLHVPPGSPRLGEDFYVFTPSFHRPIPRDSVPAFIARLPSSALMMPTTKRGIVALHLLSELSTDRAAEMQAVLASQSDGLNQIATDLGLTADSRVMLESGDEVHIFTFAAMSTCVERFAVDVEWNIGRVEGNPEVSARLHLLRADGFKTAGAGRPPRQK